MNSIPIAADTATAPIHHRRPVLPVLTLLVAGAAFSLAVVAIATDDAGSNSPQPSPLLRTAAAIQAPLPWWADPAQHPANQDPSPVANQAVEAASGDATSSPGDGAGTTRGGPTAGWAERQ
jgi:hypothetical protein